MQSACTILYLLPAAHLVLPYFFSLFYKWHNFQETVIEHKMCVLIFSTTFVWKISYCQKNWVGYFHKCTHVFHIIKFLENSYADSWVVPCRWMVRWTDITKLIVAFRYFANMPQCVMRTLSKLAPEINVIWTWEYWYKLSAVKETQKVHTEVY
jgi:hypothetical protein